MRDVRWWRWGGLGLIGILAALFASFNAGERVALHLGFMVLYQIKLVPLIFVAFVAGMATMFLLGLRHDMRVRKALREAGFGEPIASGDAAAMAMESGGGEPAISFGRNVESDAPEESAWTRSQRTPEAGEPLRSSDAEPDSGTEAEPPPDAEPPPRYPP